MLAGPLSFRLRASSSRIATSRTQCSLWRVGRRTFTPGLSQNGAGTSRFTPLPSSEAADCPLLPMHEEIRLPFGDLLDEEAGPCLVSFEPLVLPHRPGHQRLVEVPVDRIERRWREPPVIRDPAP